MGQKTEECCVAEQPAALSNGSIGATFRRNQAKDAETSGWSGSRSLWEEPRLRSDGAKVGSGGNPLMDAPVTLRRGTARSRRAQWPQITEGKRTRGSKPGAGQGTQQHTLMVSCYSSPVGVFIIELLSQD